MRANKAKKYLLAVDDEEDLKFLFEHFFSDQVCSGELNLEFCATAKECLDKLKVISGEIVVLSDICMPDVSGIDLLKTISEKYPSVKVFLVSAYDEDKYLEDMKKYGAQGYISKPLEFDSLKDTVLRILDITH